MEIRYFTVSDVRYFIIIGFLCGICAVYLALLIKNFLEAKTGNPIEREVPNPLGWHQEQSIQDSKFKIQDSAAAVRHSLQR